MSLNFTLDYMKLIILADDRMKSKRYQLFLKTGSETEFKKAL